MTSSEPGLLDSIRESGRLEDDMQAALRTAIGAFKQSVPF